METNKNNRFFTLETETRKQFFQVPKQFMNKDSKYYNMSSDSKLLYAILADRNSLSISNGWIDENNRVYFIATIENLMELTGWGNQKVVKQLKELRKFDLLISEQKGQGKPSWHYLLQIEIEKELENQSYQQKCENHISRSVKITSQEMLKSHCNNTNINNTNINNTD
ncbi:TPA: replication initiator protein A, partial [Clostridium perfringens]|nr:replication initiator protein A [Clostridium perfringens]